MTPLIKKLILISSTLLAMTVAQAGEKVSDKTDQQIRQALKQMAPSAKVLSIETTPMKGVKEVTLDSGRGGEVYYVSDSGEFLITGNMYNTQTREDLTEAKKAGIRKELVAKFGPDKRIDFFPKDMKHHITVFTDIDCGYCRKLHSQMDEYNKRGIGVSYLFFPRAGLKSNSYDKAVAVWCADDKQDALTKAKTGIQMDLKKCDNPVAEQYKTGQAVGVSGTPAIVLDNGTLMPGYLPPDALLQRLDYYQALEKNKAAKAKK